MINEQEEADARVARELAEKMEIELEMERRRQAEENEKMARKLQKELFNDKRYAMPPSNDPIPPNVLPKKSNIQNYTPTIVENVPVSPNANSRLNYVSLDLSNAPVKLNQQRSPTSRTQYTQVIPQKSQQPNYDLPNEQYHHYDHINLQSHTPEKKHHPQLDQSYRQRTPTNLPEPPLYVNAEPVDRHQHRTTSPDHYENSGAYNRQHGHSNDKPPARPERTDKQHDMLKQTDAFKRMKSQSEATRGQFEKLSLEKYDEIMGNMGRVDECDGAQGGQDVVVDQRNVDRIKAMKELGVPADEIIEIDRRIAQQERDEVSRNETLIQFNPAGRQRTFHYFFLGICPSPTTTRKQNSDIRRTRSTGSDGSSGQGTGENAPRKGNEDRESVEIGPLWLTFLFSFVVVQERAKAKRAKERARQRKLQQKQEESDNANSGHSRTHSELDGDSSYSDPIDLIAPHNNDSSKASNQAPASRHTQQNGNAQHTQAHNMYYQDAVNLYDVNYSNPVDLLRSTSRSPISSGAVAKQSHHQFDDDMYERPINDLEYSGPKRPNNLEIRHVNRPHQPPVRPPKPDRDELSNVAAAIDPTYTESKVSPTTPNIQHNHSTNLPDFLDQSSSPVPPYMPIQGTRRNISVDNNKKKKGKDKCTHQ